MWINYYVNFDVEDTLGKLWYRGKHLSFVTYKVFPNTFSVVAPCPFLRDFLRLIIYKALLLDNFEEESLVNIQQKMESKLVDEDTKPYTQ